MLFGLVAAVAVSSHPAVDEQPTLLKAETETLRSQYAQLQPSASEAPASEPSFREADADPPERGDVGDRGGPENAGGNGGGSDDSGTGSYNGGADQQNSAGVVATSYGLRANTDAIPNSPLSVSASSAGAIDAGLSPLSASLVVPTVIQSSDGTIRVGATTNGIIKILVSGEVTMVLAPASRAGNLAFAGTILNGYASVEINPGVGDAVRAVDAAIDEATQSAAEHIDAESVIRALSGGLNIETGY